MAAVAHNMKPDDGRFDKQSIQDLIGDRSLVQQQLDEIFHAPAFESGSRRRGV
ncbi:MAG: hypothetical protein U0165_12135 [Polyangiaceae bacterium]